MNKIKKIILPIICAFFVSSACVVKSNNAPSMDNDTKNLISAGGILCGIVAIVWGGFDVHLAMLDAYGRGTKRAILPLLAQPTVGVIKVAAGAVAAVLGLKSLVEKNFVNEKMKTTVALDEKLKDYIKKTVKEESCKNEKRI